MIRSFTSERAIRKIITSLPKGVTSPPPELLHILDISPINHLPVLIQILNVERRPSSRSVLRGLLGKYIEEQADQVVESLEHFEDAIALDLIDSLVSQNSEYAHNIIWTLRNSPSPPILHKILNLLIEEGATFKYKSWLLELLSTTKVPGVRAKVLGLTRNIAERELFSIMQDILEKDNNISNEEAELLGENLVASHAGRAKQLFQDWTRSNKWYSLRNLTIRRSQQMAAISGLSVLPGDKSVEQILAYRSQTDEFMAEFCMKRLVKRRQLGIV